MRVPDVVVRSLVAKAELLIADGQKPEDWNAGLTQAEAALLGLDLLDARARVKELTNLIENAYQNHGCTSGETYTPGCDFCSLRRALRRGEEAGE